MVGVLIALILGLGGSSALTQFGILPLAWNPKGASVAAHITQAATWAFGESQRGIFVNFFYGTAFDQRARVGSAGAQNLQGYGISADAVANKVYDNWQKLNSASTALVNITWSPINLLFGAPANAATNPLIKHIILYPSYWSEPSDPQKAQASALFQWFDAYTQNPTDPWASTQYDDALAAYHYSQTMTILHEETHFFLGTTDDGGYQDKALFTAYSAGPIPASAPYSLFNATFAGFKGGGPGVADNNADSYALEAEAMFLLASPGAAQASSTGGARTARR